MSDLDLAGIVGEALLLGTHSLRPLELRIEDAKVALEAIPEGWAKIDGRWMRLEERRPEPNAARDHYGAEIKLGDWQDIMSRRLAEIRELDGPGPNEFFEAAEMGAALSEAGLRIV